MALMMNVESQIGYHTCKLKNGFEYIKANTPFKSGNGSNQWLTQGFYFWTDSDYWAKKWGTPSQRAIGKFKIQLCLRKETLDLVGNVEHQIEFVRLKNVILQGLQKDKRTEITVHQIISKLRTNKQIFPYLAIKAEDNRRVDEINFVDPDISGLKLRVITPQQLCVFEEARPQISLEGFVEPDSFSRNMPTN